MVLTLGDLHMDPRDLEHSFEGREHVKAVLANEENTFVVGAQQLSYFASKCC